MNESVDLELYDDAWKAAKAKGNKTGFDPLPDGNYLVEIRSCFPTKTKTGSDCFKWEFNIIGPKFQNRKIFRTDVLSTKKIEYLQEDFAKLGIDMPRISEFYDYGGSLIGQTIEVTLKTNDGNDGRIYQNCYINKAIGGAEEDSPF